MMNQSNALEIKENSYKGFASFDVFDTLLTRAIGKPTSLFLLLGRFLAKKNLISISAESFLSERVSAEHRAYSLFGMSVNLSHIYHEMNPFKNLKEQDVQVLMQHEIECERLFIRPVHRGIEKVREARRQRMKVIFISDHYLSEQVIRSFLIEHGIYEDGDALYVSCEKGCNKSRGLFDMVAKAESLACASTLHLGNHPQDDFQAARKFGWRSKLFSDCDLISYEKILEDSSEKTEGLSSMMAGASRLVRLNLRADSPKKMAIRDAGAGLVGPVLTSYVLWLLQQAQQRNLKRLYFVARDGQILYKIARQLIEKLSINIEPRYLYGSRQAWHLPSIYAITDREFSWILDKTRFLSMEGILARLCIQPVEISHLLKKYGFSSADWIRDLSFQEIDELKTSLFQDKDFEMKILERATEKRKLMIAYLEQEGLYKDSDWAFVDLGWWGRIQDSLALATGLKPLGFYMGLDKGSVNPEMGTKVCYLFDKRQSTGHVNNQVHFPMFMEAFCQADHGGLSHYKKEGNKIIPVLLRQENTPVLEWGLEYLHNSIGAFVENLILDNNYLDKDADMRGSVMALVSKLWLFPDDQDVVAWGAFPYEMDQRDTTIRSFAEPYSWKDVGTTFSRGFISRQVGQWREGSMAATPEWIRKAMIAALWAGEKRIALKERIKKIGSFKFNGKNKV